MGRKGILHEFVTPACHIVWLASSGASVIWEQGEKRREEKKKGRVCVVLATRTRGRGYRKAHRSCQIGQLGILL